MQTINPVYTTFIAHRDPLGAIAIYLHYMFNYYKLEEKMNFDWIFNKSWRGASSVSVLSVGSPQLMVAGSAHLRL
ncbi:hypothetical protein HYDPIDRAFT_108106 [Hydnomerulius pinastri MD-312]|nr:hypothetical protein HYDPIDRAFT_108106 [Hydnomerulius pinastri MD-312]